MSLTVEKLNDDTTFLLAFAPSFAPKNTKSRRKFPGAFTVLWDPWLQGSSSIMHPAFQTASHTSGVAIKSLTELELQPDVIIISQDKPDHCHRETLRSLPRDTRTKILATPAAAKKIKSWKHFDDDIVHIMKPYCPDKPGVLTKIRLEPYTSTSSAGEITIANLATKYDITGLHNAIGITYRPPGSLLSAVNDGETVSLSDMARPFTAPSKLHKKRSALTLPDTFTTPRTSSTRDRSSSSASRPDFLDPLGRSKSTPSGITLPYSDTRRVNAQVEQLTRRHKEKPLSIIYTPHGIAPATLRPYLTHHLQRIGAFPLTALFHCMNTEENPWFMGGMVANGAPGGAGVAAETEARYWVGAHDELKSLKGAATLWLRSRRYSKAEVEGMLWERESKRDVKRRDGTEVRLLGVGERMRVEG